MLKNIIYVILVLACYSATAHAGQVRCRVVHIIDGDTVVCLTAQQKNLRIRLANIDAPELGQAYGQRAKQYLSSLVGGKYVRVTIRAKDKYKRFIGILYRQNKEINLAMVSAGLSWVYRPYRQVKKTYQQAQTSAQQQKRGLWAAKQPIAPWQYRQQQMIKKLH